MNNLNSIKEFYQNILGLELLGSFEDHNGYNGIFLGFKNENWHLEFTENGTEVKKNKNEEDLLVFYPQSEKSYDNILAKIEQFDIETSIPSNPYWLENGLQISDPEGNLIVVCGQKID